MILIEDSIFMFVNWPKKLLKCLNLDSEIVKVECLVLEIMRILIVFVIKATKNLTRFLLVLVSSKGYY